MVILDNPWEDWILTQIIKTPIPQRIHKHNILKRGNLPKHPHLQYDLLLYNLQAFALFLQIVIDILPNIKIFEVQKNTTPAMLENLYTSLPEKVSVTSDCTDFVEF